MYTYTYGIAQLLYMHPINFPARCQIFTRSRSLFIPVKFCCSRSMRPATKQKKDPLPKERVVSLFS